MPSEAAAWCDGVLGAACTGESRCSGRGFLRGIVGLCGGSARHVERAVAGGVFGARARDATRPPRIRWQWCHAVACGAASRFLFSVCVVAYDAHVGWRSTRLARCRTGYGPGRPARRVSGARRRCAPSARRFVFCEQHAHAQRPIRKRKRSRKCGTYVFNHESSNGGPTGVSRGEAMCMIPIYMFPRCSRPVEAVVSACARPPVAL